MRKTRLIAAAALWLLAAFLAVAAVPATKPATDFPTSQSQPTTRPAPPPDFVPMDIKLPRPRYYVGPPPPGYTRLPPEVVKAWKPRPVFLVPPGTVNLALNRPVSSSDKEPVIGTLDQITDGDKRDDEGSWVELQSGLQWVQIDLGRVCDIHGICMWHKWDGPWVYHDVVVMISNDSEFADGVKTVFNNDRDNSARLGKGEDPEYVDCFQGWLIDTRGPTFAGVRGRYVRCYSNGNNSDAGNRYTEIEVYGKAEK